MAVDPLRAYADQTHGNELAPCAASERHTRGRLHPEEVDDYRTLYQRDCDRIIHSAAFRSLEYKTQVLVNHADGLFRTRLTHSMEVAKLARALTRALRLNEDLAEAIALAHDLGHTPFGHIGQDTLNRCMQEYGGFEHNLQSLRVVDELEHKYADFAGLNLSFETREGILKRCRPELAQQLGPVGARFLEGGQPTLEAQLVDLADRVAYTNHDLDDGLRLGLLELEAVQKLELYARAYEAATEAAPQQSRHSLLHETNRRMISAMMDDLIGTTGERLAQAAPESPQAVRGHDAPLAGFSAAMRQELAPLSRFLHERYYSHYLLRRMHMKATRIIERLFGTFLEDPHLLPTGPHAQVRQKEERRGEAGRARAIADYIASLSDRRILSEYRRIFDVTDRIEL